MTRSYVLRFFGLIVLLAFTAFFFVPIVWLLLAPTKTDHQLVFQSAFSFGSFSNFVHAWHRMFAYTNPPLLSCLENTSIYSFGGLAIAMVATIPAGYGLARTRFIGRRTLLAI